MCLDQNTMASINAVFFNDQIHQHQVMQFLKSSNNSLFENEQLIQYLTNLLLFFAKSVIWLMPLIFAIIFLKPQYFLNYKDTLRKLRIHHKALSQGPVKRYFENFFKTRIDQTNQISGECNQCGNCCLNQQCVFLEPIEDEKFQCGVYNSPFRKFSNCGAFPISSEDIERYACPGYVFNPYPVINIQCSSSVKT